MEKKRLLILSMLFLFVIPIVSAANEVSVETNPSTTAVTSGETFIVQLIIQNNMDEKHTFEFDVLDFEWIQTPVSNSVTIGPQASKTINVELMPSKTLAPGKHLLRFGVESKKEKGITDTTEMIVEVLPADTDIIFQVTEFPDVVKIDSPNSIKVNLQNRNNHDETGLSLRISSDVISESEQFDLRGLETKEFVFENLDLETKEQGEYTVVFRILKEDITIKTIKRNMIIPKNPTVLEFESTDESLLQKKSSVTKINSGNAITGAAVTEEISVFDRLFTSFEPKPDTIRREGGKYVAGWAVNLEPGEKFTVKRLTNYQIILIVFLLAILALFLGYLTFRPKVLIYKKLKTLKRGKEGISHVKVLLIVRNRGRARKGIKIVEKIPNFVNLHKEFGTVKPSSIKKGPNKSTVLIWNIDKMTKNEEVILSYQMRCKLHIIGSFMLPRAVAVYKKKKRTVKSYSTPLILSSGNEK